MSDYKYTMASPLRRFLFDWLNVPLPDPNWEQRYVILSSEEFDRMLAQYRAVVAELEEVSQQLAAKGADDDFTVRQGSGNFSMSGPMVYLEPGEHPPIDQPGIYYLMPGEHVFDKGIKGTDDE